MGAHFCTILSPSESHPSEKHKIISKKGCRMRFDISMKDCDWLLKRKVLVVKYAGVWSHLRI